MQRGRDRAAPLRERGQLLRQVRAVRLECGRLAARVRARLARGHLRARRRLRQLPRLRLRLRAWALAQYTRMPLVACVPAALAQP